MLNPPDQSAGQFVVSPDNIVERLCRTELGLALWRAAVAEETVEIFRSRIEHLEQQKSPSAEAPDLPATH